MSGTDIGRTAADETADFTADRSKTPHSGSSPEIVSTVRGTIFGLNHVMRDIADILALKRYEFPHLRARPLLAPGT